LGKRRGAAHEGHTVARTDRDLPGWFVIAGVVPLGFLFWRRNL